VTDYRIMLPLKWHVMTDDPLANTAATAVPGFDYAAIKVPHREFFRTAVDRIRGIARRTVADLVEAGQLLAEGRDKIQSRMFRKWLSSELPWSVAHSYRLIQVAEAFAPYVRPDAVHQFDATALYLLARPEVKPEARTCALQLAEQRPVTAADAREILEATRPIPDLNKHEVTIYHRDAREREGKTEPPPVTHEGWAALMALLDGCNSLHVTKVQDEDDTDWSITIYSDDQRPRNFTGATFEEAVRIAANPAVRERECVVCKQTKPIGAYCRNKREPGGYNRKCKVCEAKRLNRKNRAAAKAAGEGEAATRRPFGFGRKDPAHQPTSQ
jgi:hypothetical protein